MSAARVERADTEGIEHIGNPRFLELVDQMIATHKAKAAGYSGQDNPDTWANFREAENWGTTPLKGCFVRMGDKYRRIQNLVRNPDNDRVGESIKVTLMDLANYAIIAVCLFEEQERMQGLEVGQWPPLNEDGMAKKASEVFKT